MSETTEADRLVTSLTTALDEEEATARESFYEGQRWITEEEDVYRWSDDELVHSADRKADARHIARQDPASTLRRVAAHREILNRYAETLRDYARTLERARGGPVGNADLDDLEAELPVLRSIVEIVAGIYEVTP